MRKLIIILVVAMGFTSCGPINDFFRGQREKDAESNGKAILLEAQSSKQAAIEEAKAENESAILKANTKVTLAQSEADAEVIRARGVAKANEIIGESLKDNEAYLRYLWITGLHDDKGERIYIPTEAGMPILEAK